MKEIYKLLLVVILLLQLTACNDDSPEEPNYIQFGELVLEGTSSLDEEKETRASIVVGVGDQNKNYQGKMNLYGMLANTTATPYINNMGLTVTNGNTNTQVLWPDGALTFYAFAAGSNTVSGLTVLPQSNKAKPDCNIGAYNALSNQQDLLFGATGPFSTGTMTFEFQHVLSRITFQAKKATGNLNTIVLDSIKLIDVYNNLEGKVEVSSSDNTIAATTWTCPAPKEAGKTGTQKIVVGKTIETTLNYLPSNTTAVTNDNFFMFPHTKDQFTSQGAKLVVYYKEGGTKESKSFDLKDYEAWGMGEWINYVITFEKRNDVRMYVEYKPWTTTNVYSDTLLGRKLNISETEVVFYKLNNELTASNNEIYFWTNQEDAYIEEDINADTKFDDVFENLNWRFIPGTGWGYFTLNLKKDSKVGEYNIVLNVGGLRKKVMVNILDLKLDIAEVDTIKKEGYPDDLKATSVTIPFSTNGDAVAYIDKYFYYRDLKTYINNIFKNLSSDEDNDGSNFTFSSGVGTIKLELEHFGKDEGYIILNIQRGAARVRKEIKINMAWKKKEE